jgi:hypothetical protein
VGIKPGCIARPRRTRNGLGAVWFRRPALSGQNAQPAAIPNAWLRRTPDRRSRSAPGLAQTSDFYIVQDASTKKCTIVDKKPTVTTTTVVGNGVCKTRTEAESAMKTVKVCTSN